MANNQKQGNQKDQQSKQGGKEKSRQRLQPDDGYHSIFRAARPGLGAWTGSNCKRDSPRLQPFRYSSSSTWRAHSLTKGMPNG